MLFDRQVDGRYKAFCLSWLQVGENSLQDGRRIDRSADIITPSAAGLPLDKSEGGGGSRHPRIVANDDR